MLAFIVMANTWWLVFRGGKELEIRCVPQSPGGEKIIEKYGIFGVEKGL